VTTLDPLQSATIAGLRYSTDDRPGIRRVKRRGGFNYIGPDGKPLADADEISRIRKLAIPPAYTDVWISPDPHGHLQATGRDARGRKQYRYHPRWREVRDETKFDRMIAFAKALPAIRAAVRRDLALTGLPRRKVLATVVALLESTMIRIGNDEYARHNDSYGLTTMQEDHVRINGDALRFNFRGKSGREHRVTVRDKRLARIVRQMRDLPGHDLFNYVDDDGAVATVSSQDVNSYLREIAGADFTAKDFRTWEGTLTCTLALAADPGLAAGGAKTRVTAAIVAVSERLGNTPAVCKKSYIHPGVIAEFLAGGTLVLARRSGRRNASPGPNGLSADESRVLAFIEQLTARDEKAHLSELLATSVRRAKRTRAA